MIIVYVYFRNKRSNYETGTHYFATIVTALSDDEAIVAALSLSMMRRRDGFGSLERLVVISVVLAITTNNKYDRKKLNAWVLPNTITIH